MTIPPVSPASRSYFSQRLRLHYLDWGNSDKPTLVLLHGGRDHARSWDWTARALRDDWHIVAPDLRGHGDSGWSPDGSYQPHDFVYDFAQFIHQLDVPDVTIIAHSLGGSIATRYTALFPDMVRKLVTIEGMGTTPTEWANASAMTMPERWRTWVSERRALAGREARKYPSIDAALRRMREENQFLSEEQARHLTVHGVNRTEDGSFVWKFDNYLRNQIPLIEREEEMQQMWQAITCPVLLCHGRNSFASDPGTDGRAEMIANAQIAYFDDAGHWLHHDQFDRFIAKMRAFL